MSGIYIHIPYCKVKCHYCDFHFSTNQSSVDDMVEAICLELTKRVGYLRGEDVSTVYFGGGTPSVLSKDQLARILNTIQATFVVKNDAEITFECNPDDLSETKLQELKSAGINRLSIGVQSFDDEVLKFMNRAHSSEEAVNSILLAQEIGFDNITADLIYGIPDKDLDYWENQVNQMVELGIPHISAYCLTIEKNTVFGHKYDRGELQTPSDEATLQQFRRMIDTLTSHGYLHYEISNFARKGFISQHNSAYWLGTTYLGVGPSAHSYDGDVRGWNISNNPQYIKKVLDSKSVFEVEYLTDRDKFNDYILTRLRTQWGADLEEIQKLGEGIDLTEFDEALERHLDLQNIILIKNTLRLSEHGKFIADKVASDLFV
ncbi:MAG: radical SAM family heme chaperone HemW [Crocinitomicaceae bacterium]|nr:radical SAM family heme chaperone HemW [Crocinitomicaceae bacterium]